MSRPASSRARPSLSLTPALLARAAAYVAAGHYRSVSALVDAALLAHLDGLDARARFAAALPLASDEIDIIEIRVDHDGDPVPFQAAARALYPDVQRVTLRRGRDAEVCGDGCAVIRSGDAPWERVWATERRLDHEGWRRSKVAPPDYSREGVLAYCQKIGAPPPTWL